MPTCPHTNHDDSATELSEARPPISFCREKCYRTFFFCPDPKCAEANRPLARHCRRCGATISFDDVLAGYQPQYRFNNQTSVSAGFKLSGYGVGEVYALESYKGHLFVVADRQVFVFDIHKLYEPLRIFAPPDGRGLRGVTIASLPDDDLLLVTTSRSVYGLSLLGVEESEPELLYQASEPSSVIFHRAFRCAGQIYLLERDPDERATRLVELPSKTAGKTDGKTVATVQGFCHQPLALSDDRILCVAEEQLLVYDPKSGESYSAKTPERLSQSAPPAYSREMNFVYVAGQDGLWRVDLRGRELTTTSMITRDLSDPHLAAGADQVVVAHLSGFLALDPFGQIKWDSSGDFITVNPDGHPPIVEGNYIIYSAIGKLGGSDVLVHSRRKPSEYERIPFQQRALCSPLLYLGRLIVAVGDEQSVELKIKEAEAH